MLNSPLVVANSASKLWDYSDWLSPSPHPIAPPPLLLVVPELSSAMPVLGCSSAISANKF
ncbi:hypothetical protein OUZ56_018407 [Daphnia magna]|uniref:Uncharacterized protein n=1 Tax=Daphnia magna TaxID=35525 RepID=A0ABQ9Z8T1_9CRUS|nr:hypothetical protein OUZ56_018407 [Daphnia magna]